MAIVEYREFYKRQVQKNTGAYPDKETGFPVKEIVIDQNGVSRDEYNRFLKNHFPSPAVFDKLFESITFKLNDEDTGTTDQQGLVRIAIGLNVVTRADAEQVLENGNAKNYTTVVVPSTLPIVSAGADITVTPRIRRVSDDVEVATIPPGDRQLYYVDYEVAFSGVIPPGGSDNIQQTDFVFERVMSTAPVERTGYLQAFTKQIPAGLLADNDYIELDVELDERAAGLYTTGALSINIGNDANPENRDIISFPNFSPLDEDAGFSRIVNIKIYKLSNDSYILYMKANNIRSQRFTTIPVPVGSTNIVVDGIPTRDSAFSAGTNSETYYRHYVDQATNVNWTNAVNISVMIGLEGNPAGTFVNRRITTHCKAVLS